MSPKRKKQKERVRHGLGDVVRRELGTDLDKGHQKADWGGEITPEMIEYAAKDSQVLPPLVETLGAKIREDELEAVLDLERRVTPAMVWLSAAGVPIDEEGWKGYEEKTKTEIGEILEKLDNLAPYHPEEGSWNWNSWPQLVRAFGLVGIKLPNTTKETLSGIDHPLAVTLLEYRDAKSGSTLATSGSLELTREEFTPPGSRWVPRPAGCHAHSPTSRTSTRRTRCAASSVRPRARYW